MRDQDYDAFTSKRVNGDPPNRAKLECWAGRFGSIKKAGGHTPEIAPTAASKVSAQKCPLFFSHRVVINLVELPVKSNTVALTNEIGDMAKVRALQEDFTRGK